MKRNLALLLALVMMLGCFSLSASAEELAPMTTEPITLTFSLWGQDLEGNAEATAALVKQFTEKYPNITVEEVIIEQAQWDSTLQQKAAIGELPDVFGVFSVSAAVMNEWALPLDSYYAADPAAGDMYEAVLTNSKIGGSIYSVPWVLYPHMVIVNKTMFENYNEPLPSYDWKVDEFFEIAERLSHPEEFYFGTAQPLYEDLYPGWFNGNQGKWGWDGENYNFDEVWVAAIEKKYELMDADVLEWESAEDKIKFLGSDAWPPAWGRVAMTIGFPWDIPNFDVNGINTQQSGCEFLFYPLPTGESGKVMHIIDNAVVAASTKHPREAWELLKWLTWGEEALLCRQAANREMGLSVSRLPATKNEAAWKDLIDNTAREDLKALYGSLTDVVPSNWPVAPGWGLIETWINENEIYAKIDSREITPAEIASELNQKANELKDQWLAELAAK
jgi:ABC-type sugar transport system, periplasmic component